MDTVNSEGWIKLHRKSIASRVFQSDGLWKVWTWCLMRANHDDAWVPVKTGKGTSEVFVKRGQFIFGRKAAAKELKMRPTTVQDRMKKLANMENLVTESVTHYSLITVCNYDIYQGDKNNEASPNPSTNRQPTVTNKNDKNEKNLKNGRKRDSDPRVKEFFDYWGKTFRGETGKSYLFSYGKEGKLIKDLLHVHSLDTLQEMTKIFFKDEQCKRRGVTVGIFFQEVNRLISQRAMNPLEQAKRELRTGEEARSD